MSNATLWKNWFRKTDDGEALRRLLRSVPIFSQLDDNELRQVGTLMHNRTYTDGESVFFEGQPGNGMYVIMRGSVRIVLHHGQPDEVQIALLEVGDFFGEFSLLDESPRSATCVASGVTELGGFFRPDLRDSVASRPQTGIKIVLKLADVVAERLRRTNADLRLTKEELKGEKDKAQKLTHELEGYRSRGVVIERR